VIDLPAASAETALTLEQQGALDADPALDR
jgi:hypothetical protein